MPASSSCIDSLYEALFGASVSTLLGDVEVSGRRMEGHKAERIPTGDKKCDRHPDQAHPSRPIRWIAAITSAQRRR
jgi:hypothetical protein